MGVPRAQKWWRGVWDDFRNWIVGAAGTDDEASGRSVGSAWERFAGLYRGLWGDQHVVLLNKHLVILTPNGSNLEDPVTLEPIGNGRFRLVAPTGGGGAYGVLGEVVRFVEESGRPMRMYLGDTWIDRVPDH